MTELRVLGGSGDADTGATLALISQARRNLAEAQTLPDIRRVMETASLAADAAERAARLAEAQRLAGEVVEAANEAANDAAAVRIEAQAKAGEMLREMAQRGERAKGGEAGRRESQPVTLDGLGVSKMESSRWQQVAAVPPEVRQEYVDETKAARGEVSTAGLLRHAESRPGDATTSRPAGRRSVDHAAIGAEAQKQIRTIYRGLLALPGYRPESLVATLDNSQRRDLLRALSLLPAWIEDVRKELAIHRVEEV